MAFQRVLGFEDAVTGRAVVDGGRDGGGAGGGDGGDSGVTSGGDSGVTGGASGGGASGGDGGVTRGGAGAVTGGGVGAVNDDGPGSVTGGRWASGVTGGSGASGVTGNGVDGVNGSKMLVQRGFAVECAIAMRTVGGEVGKWALALVAGGHGCR